jgi:heme-degrading monooxygenase HmoA
MHVQVVTYRTEEMTEREFVDANQEFAAAMAEAPGLLAKIWLKDPNDSVYGGVYLWRDRDAFEAFVAGELWRSVLDDESISEVDSRDFETMEELTASTQPGLKVV